MIMQKQTIIIRIIFNEKAFRLFPRRRTGVPDRAIQDYGMISSVYFKRSALVCALAAAFPLAAQAEGQASTGHLVERHQINPHHDFAQRAA